MEFICTYCNKPITSLAIVLGKTHFAHEDCVKLSLSPIDAEIFFEEIKHPRKPNNALKKAWKRYKDFVK